MSIAAALTSIDAALTIAKAMRQIEKNYDAAVLKAQIVDLMTAVTDAKGELLEAREQLQVKDAEIKRLTASLETKRDLVEVRGYLHEKGEDGRPKGSPFCPACYANDGTLIRPANLLDEHWQCPSCKALYSNLTDFR